MRRILVVDDEEYMRKLIRIHLDHAGFAVDEAQEGDEACAKLETDVYHLIILDVMMPGKDGWETLRDIRAFLPSQPMLMLTARTATEEKVFGLKLGADDYLTKPFDGNELVARVQAILRRTFGNGEERIHFDTVGLDIDQRQREVSIRGHITRFTPTEFDLLLLLATHPGRTYPRLQIMEQLWSLDSDADLRNVDSHVKNIREKLREVGLQDEIIKTVWGVGYRFEVPTSSHLEAERTE